MAASETLVTLEQVKEMVAKAVGQKTAALKPAPNWGGGGGGLNTPLSFFFVFFA